MIRASTSPFSGHTHRAPKCALRVARVSFSERIEGRVGGGDFLSFSSTFEREEGALGVAIVGEWLSFGSKVTPPSLPTMNILALGIFASYFVLIAVLFSIIWKSLAARKTSADSSRHVLVLALATLSFAHTWYCTWGKTTISIHTYNNNRP